MGNERTKAAVPEHHLKYREVLVGAEQKAQEEFDKTVLSLSGGGLGVSFVFLKDVIGSAPAVSPYFLTAAWVAWAMSILAVLFSYHLSHRTIHRMIEQIDAGQGDAPGFGGWHASITQWLNAIGAVLFVVGVLSITVFACVNFTHKEASHAKPQAAPTSTSATQASPAAR